MFIRAVENGFKIDDFSPRRAGGWWQGKIVRNQWKDKPFFIRKDIMGLFKIENPLYGFEKLEILEAVENAEVICNNGDGWLQRIRESFVIVKPVK